MALLVEEIMNRELFSCPPTERVAQVLSFMRTLGVRASPVIDAGGRAVGFVTLGELVLADPEAQVRSVMSRPVLTVLPRAPIEEAAKLVGETGFHHLVVADEDANTLGIVSSLDIIRGLIGQPAQHPDVFPHYESATGFCWSNDADLDFNHVESAPESSGVVALVYGGIGRPERIVWAEYRENLRRRLIAMLSETQIPVLQHWLNKKQIRFRVAETSDRETGSRVVDALQRRAGYARE